MTSTVLRMTSRALGMTGLCAIQSSYSDVILREQSEPKDLPAGLQLREQRSFDYAQDDKYCAQDDKYCAQDDK